MNDFAIVTDYRIRINNHSGIDDYIVSNHRIIGNTHISVNRGSFADFNLSSDLNKGAINASLPIFADASILAKEDMPDFRSCESSTKLISLARDSYALSTSY